MTLKPLKIGNVTVDFPVMLAPMAGYTDAVMRTLARRYHCGMAYTEVTSAEGIVRGSKQTLQMLATAPGERPIAAHIYGANPDILAQAAVFLEQSGRFQIIDLNCGCPVAKIVAKGAGAALMKHPQKIAQIIMAIKQAVSLPVTVKTRLGLSPDRMNISEIAHAVEESGGNAITIHARVATQRHTGQTDWSVLARIKSELSIPVIGNGGIQSAEDVFRMLAETGVDGVMIGKAAVGNPWIFQAAWSLMHGRRSQQPSMQERKSVIEEHLRLLIIQKEQAAKSRRHSQNSAEKSAVLHFRAHLVGYIRGLKKSAEVRRTLQDMHQMADVMAALAALQDGEARSCE